MKCYNLLPGNRKMFVFKEQEWKRGCKETSISVKFYFAIVSPLMWSVSIILNYFLEFWYKSRQCFNFGLEEKFWNMQGCEHNTLTHVYDLLDGLHLFLRLFNC